MTAANLDTPPAITDAAHWPRRLAAYRDGNTLRSVLELIVTVIPLIATWSLMWAALQFDVALCMLLSVPAAGFLVRLFMIQHDCGHGAFFRTRALNDWVGRAISVVTLTPYDVWKRTHAIHHAGVGNLKLRGIGDMATMTVREYLRVGPWSRMWYRLYRHPAVLFGLGPAYMFLLQNRLPIGLMRRGWRPWLSAMATNLATATVVAGLVWIGGLLPLLLIYLPTTLLAASAGVWLFFVQHQFENTHWAADEDWKHPEAALKGSSHYVLPAVLRWFTANIGVHQVHHLNSRIPFYRLPEVLRNHPELAAVGRLTVVESLRCVRLALWDEESRRLVSFGGINRPAAA
jgi:omega-6 fatty acid desaturase (delta-12 desaturase)